MKIHPFSLILAFLASIALPAHSFAEKSDTVLSTTSADQSSLAITVYNVNLGLVKDQRTINLDKGPSIEVHGRSIADNTNECLYQISLQSESLQVLEQNYEYDL